MASGGLLAGGSLRGPPAVTWHFSRRRDSQRLRGRRASPRRPSGVPASSGNPLSQGAAGESSRLEVVTRSIADRKGMRVFVVRHEKRDRGNATFLSPLLPDGLRDADSVLVERIGEINPTHVYASPFLRVLQTVKPYVDRQLENGGDLAVNVDYSLYESPNPDPDNFIGQVHAEWYGEFHVSRIYASFLDPERLKGGWGFGDTLPERTAAFLAHLEQLHVGTNHRILLASHQYTIHSLLSITTGEDVADMNFPQGEVAELNWRAALLPKSEVSM